ncbi:NOB1 family endonuclease [Halalkalicoccus jeotgali]|uniref:Nucleic acid-binding protein n=1 Tax=Halalkalicoccus jeotgali (strain DSM 18796 / CECT 7217 / JCM 14584 / KCTC 4019 / B3) TaxID=795797 RepID=D8J8X4_HALJB|nr:NOB1 family endonuclease [Halalkalicoccus jeotgali]ADJ14309.1 nucleic acid-binding protein consists of a PIN domain and a Zn-ribbon module-like protein [Halalkalicoccus jeotgali B3]ELY40572.1 nucleic acid-binding protein [Halalkalicoccus jeotgali B3]
MYVLDSSAFIHEYHTTEQTASIPLVREELEDESAYRYDAMEGSGMHIHIPTDETIDTVRRAAAELGDLEELSDTDIRLVATTFELDGTLVTDDYAMQNVAEKLNVTVEVIAREGITEQRQWSFQCQGCGREFDRQLDRCEVCGSPLARKNPT